MFVRTMGSLATALVMPLASPPTTAGAQSPVMPPAQAPSHGAGRGAAPLTLPTGPERPGTLGGPQLEPTHPPDPRSMMAERAAARGDWTVHPAGQGVVDDAALAVDLVPPECDASLVVRRGTGMGSGRAKRSREVGELAGIGMMLASPLGLIDMGVHGLLIGLATGWLFGEAVVPPASTCGDPVPARDLLDVAS